MSVEEDLPDVPSVFSLVATYLHILYAARDWQLTELNTLMPPGVQKQHVHALLYEGLVTTEATPGIRSITPRGRRYLALLEVHFALLKQTT